MSKIEKYECSCGARYGRFHKIPCQYEECPFCHGQLESCGCCYVLLGIDSDKEPVYSEGLSPKQENAWAKLLRQKGLVRVGSEIRSLAGKNWRSERRNEIVSLIAKEMISLQEFDEVRIKSWSDRLTALANASPVFLEMNQKHILNGDPVEWNPPSK